MSVIKTKFKNIDALQVDCGKMLFTLIPEQGMKLASAVDKSTGYEFLHRNPSPTYRKASYAENFVDDGECAGFDDMFPTIDPCFYPSFPWSGTAIPDHGEVWSMKYDYDIADEKIISKVNSVRFAYTLEKTYSVKDDSTLRIDYTAKNPTQFPFNFLWAAHVMLNAEEGARYIVPPECTRGITMFSNNDRIGVYGDKFDFPINTDCHGVKHDMLQMRSKDILKNEKYYVADKLKNGFLGITYPASGFTFRLDFSADTVPYIGILNNECGWDGMYMCILEPCTAPYDRPDFAMQHKLCSVIPPYGEYKWYLELSAKK